MQPDEEKKNNLPDFLQQTTDVISVAGRYQEWFLDYASYVILERAVPGLSDGLKPVQRRILHSMHEMEDGRYNKVANIIGNTMKYHPHGDASIGDALVQLAQKDLLIDMQGNWGNLLTGDSAAAARYIEARLSKFAKEVVFQPKLTQYVKSYDARNEEPVHLPIKFPLLLAQGAEGIAVGLACKILPHNFNELIDASIAILQDQEFVIYPDFPTGGMMDVSQYQQGLRGGKVRIRAKIRKEKNDLVIHEIPFGTTTSSLIESILKANEKGKIKIKKVEDNTSENAEIYIHLAPGVSQDKTIDALYAFTDCEISISPNAAIVHGDKPLFMDVHALLKFSTQQTVELLRKELELSLLQLQEQHFFLDLERIFIEQKIYIDFDGKTYDEAKQLTRSRLTPFLEVFYRPITEQDLDKLLEIKMRRITKHDVQKTQEDLLKLLKQMQEVREELAHLVRHAIQYFKNLKKNYGKDRHRKTDLKVFDTIQAKEVVVNNKKLYLQRTDGFLGFNLKKTDPQTEVVCDCSDLDDIIVFFQNGKMLVTPISEKKFVGKDIIYAAVWRKQDQTVYHMIYRDGDKGYPMAKRFNVRAITRDREYDLTRGTPSSKVLYFSAFSQGEQEVVTVHLQPIGGLRKLEFDFDFSTLPVKNTNVLGVKLTNRLIKEIVQKSVGSSTLAARAVYYDDQTLRLNTEARGKFLGDFLQDDQVLCIYKNGTYNILSVDLMYYFPDNLLHIQKYKSEDQLAAIYYDGERKNYYAKRFLLEPVEKPLRFITDHPESKLLHYSLKINGKIRLTLQADSTEKSNAAHVFAWMDITELKSVHALGKDLGKIQI